MFIFYQLGVGLPCLSIFCQFWLCEEAQCVYLRHHLGSPRAFSFCYHNLYNKHVSFKLKQMPVEEVVSFIFYFAAVTEWLRVAAVALWPWGLRAPP